jgi:preprotein translocase subunit SecB
MKTQPEKYSVNEKAVISLDNFQIVKTQFEIPQDEWGNSEVTNECNLSIKFSPLTLENDDFVFGILFMIELSNESKTFSLKLDAFSDFRTTDLKVDDDFLKSQLVKGNAPAIVFPYIRAFITNFCQNAGFNPIILPGFNFTKVIVNEGNKSQHI